ncbi:9286_t:CDS:2 [Dentiscutata heterogama]|uniref:9286_t:CDS:1 n=1 Tax=Dentiscutata heterogama TaxID=1316150 RepID=A0ACA9M2Q5_9GLOM|nr:9286_t:CDS:2 [Dentiscutata heterogama]
MVLNSSHVYSPRHFYRSFQDLDYINNRQKEILNKSMRCFWRPVTFYFYGDGGASSSWWDGYDKHEIVLFDEWYSVLDWNDVVKYLNNTPENVEQKGKTFVPFLAKYVFMTFHKPPEEVFNFRRVNINDETSTQCDWGQFYRHLDYIIKFRGMWHDELDQHTTELIFHKGSKEDFCKMLWDVKYDEGEYTCEELRTIIQELNKDQDSEVIIKLDQVYWHRHFP